MKSYSHKSFRDPHAAHRHVVRVVSTWRCCTSSMKHNIWDKTMCSD